MVKLINQYRPSLELPILYALNTKISSMLNGHGRAVAYIGDKAIGKGEIIKITQKPFEKYNVEFRKNYVFFPVDKFTSSFFIKICKELKLDNKNFEVNLEDMSQIIDTNYLALQCYDTISKLVWDKYIGVGTQDVFMGDVGIDVQKEEDIVIHVKSFHASLGMTNLILRKLKRNEAYGSMWRDRIGEFYPFLTQEDKTVIDDNYNFNPDNPRIPSDKIRSELLKIFPDNMEMKTLLPLSKELRDNYHIYKAIYKWLYKFQHTDNRGTTYFNGDLSANALLNGRTEITLSDIGFYSLFFPNLFLGKYPSVVQRICQNCLYCPDINEMKDLLSYTNPTHLKNAINRIPDADAIVIYDGDTISLTPEFSTLIKRQTIFVKKCLEYEGV